MTFSQQIISSKLLQVVIDGQKNSFIGKFKLELIKIYYLWFFMKVLWKILWMQHFFFHNTFIFSCGYFLYDILLFYFDL